MVEEKFLSGFCRSVDGIRMVAVELENGELSEIDCSYETCVHRASCEIGKAVSAALAGEA